MKDNTVIGQAVHKPLIIVATVQGKRRCKAGPSRLAPTQPENSIAIRLH